MRSRSLLFRFIFMTFCIFGFSISASAYNFDSFNALERKCENSGEPFTSCKWAKEFQSIGNLVTLVKCSEDKDLGVRGNNCWNITGGLAMPDFCKKVQKALACENAVATNPNKLNLTSVPSAGNFPVYQNSPNIKVCSDGSSNCQRQETVCTGSSCGGAYVPPKNNVPKIETKNIGGATFTKKDNSTYITDAEGKQVLVKDNGLQKKVYEVDPDDGSFKRIKGDDAKAIKELEKEAFEKDSPQDKLTREEKKDQRQREKEAAKLDKKAQEDIQKKADIAEKGIESIDADLQTLNSEISKKITDYNNEASIQEQQKDFFEAEANRTKAATCTTQLSSVQLASMQVKKLIAKQKLCAANSATAYRICPIMNSPATQIASATMSTLSSLLPTLSSAASTCKWTGTANIATQGIMIAGSTTCMATKSICESSCAKANESIEEIRANVNEGKITQVCDVNMTVSKISAALSTKEADNSGAITACEGYKADVAQMASLATNMAAAAVQAKTCADKLGGSGDGSGEPGSTVTTTQYCAEPSNANSSICNPGKSTMASLAAIKTLNTGGASQMPGKNPATKPFDPKNANLDIGAEELNDAAGIAKTEETSGSSGLTAADAVSAGGGGSGSGSGGGTGSSAAGVEEKPDSKSIGSLFSNGLNRMFGGGSGSKGKPKDTAIKSNYVDAAKRKIASEQLRSEISGASGTSNWDKIKTRYRSQQETLIGN